MRWADCHAAPDGSGAPPHGIYFAAAVTLIAGKRAALGDALGGEEESVCAALTHTARELSDAERSLFARSREEGRVMTALCLGGGTLLGILLL